MFRFIIPAGRRDADLLEEAWLGRAVLGAEALKEYPGDKAVTARYAKAAGEIRAIGVKATGWFAPDGDISNAILPSSQLIAPHKAGRSGVITQTWLGAKVWQSVQE